MDDALSKKGKRDESLTAFLAKTKEGKYAPIDQIALVYTRMPLESEVDVAEYEEDFYYSIG